jgi:hypothetical protein
MEGEPLYEAIVKRLIMADIAGATVTRRSRLRPPQISQKKTLAAHGECRS